MLVTGADGFLGSHLCEALLEGGARVGALVRASSTSGTVRMRLKNLEPVRPALEAVMATDVASPDALSCMADFDADVVFHLAADAYVERSFTHPREVMRVNLGGTENVLQLARRPKGPTRIVVTSSSEIYGPAQTPQIAEDHPLEPTSPYAASKVAADRLAIAHVRTYDAPVAIIRPFNTYGPRHPYDVIPKFIERALAGEPLVIYGDGAQSRDFTYVDDTVAALLLMGSHPEAQGRAINFGTGVATPIGALARLVVELTGSGAEVQHAEARPAEVARLCCDASQAEARFGWRARVELREGLRRHIAWYRERAAP